MKSIELRLSQWLSLKYLPCKHEDLSVDLSMPVIPELEYWSRVGCAEAGGSLRLDGQLF